MGIVITFKGINGSIDYLTTESCRDVNSYASIYVYSVHSQGILYHGLKAVKRIPSTLSVS